MNASNSNKRTGFGSGVWRTIRFFLWKHPILYLPVGMIRGNGNPLDTDFDLAIDGFPRCANSFAVAAFQSAQKTEVRLRSHKHMPPWTISAVRTGKPVCLLIREPADVALSYSIHSGWGLRPCLETFIDYYRILLPYKDDCFVAGFDEVTGDFGKVIEGINQKFGLSFERFEISEDNVRRALDNVEGVKGFVDSATPEMALRKASRPVPEREQWKEKLKAELFSETLAPLLKEARDLYDLYVN